MRNKIIIASVVTLFFLSILLFLLLTPTGKSLISPSPRREYVSSDTLEVFSWWTAPGEREGLDELFKLYRLKHGDVDVINATIVGGSGIKAQSVLQTRMKSDRPPDSFQVLAGPDFIESWAAKGFLESLTWLYEEKGWMSLFSPEVLSRISHDGEIYAVPLNIHRGNLVWYNLSIFRKYNIAPPETLEDFLEISEILAENGIAPLALGDKNTWPAVGIFENILIANFGAEGYTSLWRDSEMWNRENLEPVLKEFLKVMEYTNSDHKALTWDEAVQYVIDGKCAMISIGDFAEGYFRSEGFMPSRNFGWFPYPGTSGVFSFISDVFTLPKNALHRENAVKWLELLGSREGQDLFNPIKGSLSARLDSDISRYDGYLQFSSQSYTGDQVVGSITHGAEIRAQWKEGISVVINKLMIDYDVEKAIFDLQNIALEQLAE